MLRRCNLPNIGDRVRAGLSNTENNTNTNPNHIQYGHLMFDRLHRRNNSHYQYRNCTVCNLAKTMIKKPSVRDGAITYTQVSPPVQVSSGRND